MGRIGRSFSLMGQSYRIFFSALQGVFVASLYLFATADVVAPGLDASLMRQAFVRKNR